MGTRVAFDTLRAGSMFELTLSDNAEWFFASGDSIEAATEGPSYTFINAPSTITTPYDVKALYDSLNAAGSIDLSVPDDVRTAYEEVKKAAEYISEANQGIKDYKEAAIALAEEIIAVADTAAQAELEAIINNELTGLAAVQELKAFAVIESPASSYFYFEPNDFIQERDYTYYTELTAYRSSEQYFKINVSNFNRQTAVITMLTDVNPEEELTIPIVARTGDVGGDITIRPYGSTLSSTSAVINRETKNAGTNTTILSVKTGKDKVEIDPIMITETASGIIKDKGYTTMTIGDSFEFLPKGMIVALGGGFKSCNVTLDKAAENPFAFEGAAAGGETVKAFLNAGKNELTFTINGISSGPLRGSIYIVGLSVQNKNTASSNNSDVFMSIKEVNSYNEGYIDSSDQPCDRVVSGVIKSGIREQKGIKIASFLDYGFKLSYDSVDARIVDAYSGKKEIYAGKNGGDVAKIVLEEVVPDSWLATEDTFITLTDANGRPLEGIKFHSFEITDVNNANIITGAYLENGSYQNVEFDRRKITITASEGIKPSGRAKIKFKFNAAANFTGDVYVNIGGPGIKYSPDDLRIKVATIKAPIKVTASSTTLSLGFQSYLVNDITVTENVAGALGKGKSIDFRLVESGDSARDSYVYSHPLTVDTLKVTSGNIVFSKLDWSDTRISATIGKASNEASVFKLSGLNVKLNRDLVGVSDLLIGGDAWVETYDPQYNTTSLHDDLGRFPQEGIVVKNYITTVKADNPAPTPTPTPTPTSGSSGGSGGGGGGGSSVKPSPSPSPTPTPTPTPKPTPAPTKTIKPEEPPKSAPNMLKARNIKIIVGTNRAVVDEKDVLMDEGVVTYIDPESNRSMLPLKAVSLLFGIHEDSIKWDPETGTASIIIDDKTVDFVNGSTQMIMNGSVIDMIDENNKKVRATINPKYNRMYIPVKYLAQAFDVEVLWIASKPSAVIFNPTEQQKLNANNN